MIGSPLDDREQRYAYVAAGLGAAVSVALWAPAFDEGAGVALAAIGAAMSAVLAGAARRRSRLLTVGAALLLSFGPWGFAWIVGLPYLVLGSWLVVRAPRAPRRRSSPAVVEEPREPPRPEPPKPSKRYTPPGGRR